MRNTPLLRAAGLRALRTLLQGVLSGSLVTMTAVWILGQDSDVTTAVLLSAVATVLGAAVSSFLQGVLDGLPEVDLREALTVLDQTTETTLTNLREGRLDAGVFGGDDEPSPAA